MMQSADTCREQAIKRYMMCQSKAEPVAVPARCCCIDGAVYLPLKNLPTGIGNTILSTPTLSLRGQHSALSSLTHSARCPCPCGAAETLVTSKPMCPLPASVTPYVGSEWADREASTALFL